MIVTSALTAAPEFEIAIAVPLVSVIVLERIWYWYVPSTVRPDPHRAVGPVARERRVHHGDQLVVEGVDGVVRRAGHRQPAQRDELVAGGDDAVGIVGEGHPLQGDGPRVLGDDGVRHVLDRAAAAGGPAPDDEEHAVRIEDLDPDRPAVGEDRLEADVDRRVVDIDRRGAVGGDAAVVDLDVVRDR